MRKWLGIAGLALLLAAALAAWKGSWLVKAYELHRFYRLRRQVIAEEAQGRRNLPAQQIQYELSWLGGSTHDSARIRERLNALEAAVQDPANFQAADEQSPVSGSWGKWYTEWFFQLDASYEQISALASEGELPRYPLRFLDTINSPEKLTAHLDNLLISDLAADGINRRRELNETLADLSRLILHGQPANYPYHPQLRAALLDWLMHRARNPETGYWGAWYRKEGKIEKTNDLSITFHIVSYLDGNVPDWPRIIATTLAIKDRAYPLGWLERRSYSNHNNMDVVRLFELGWNRATPEQRAAIRVENRKMLDWCLKDSLRPDGSFALTDSDDSLETGMYFGTVFLVRLGYFDRSRRFWTDEDFPRSAEDRARIVQFIRAHQSSGGEGGTYYRSALEALGVPVRGGPAARAPAPP